MYKFLQRHPTISNRRANLIKRSRAKLSPELVKDFFANYSDSAADIPGSNIFNYDETNLTNDPGVKKALFRKGTKYAEKVMDGTKSSVSVMFCSSATGQLVPPYVVYQGANVYTDWCMGGIPGSAYNASKSGWFDTFIFTDWFENTFLPVARRLVGEKLLIGDNLASHISIKFIQLCADHNIKFVCLPPNSTDKLQPLDVGYFGPLKRKWREMLQMKKEADPSFNALNKREFPLNLKELIESIDAAKLMPPAFEKCGLFPVDQEKVLERLPSTETTEQITTNIDTALLKRLETSRYGDGHSQKRTRPKGKKVPAGKCIRPDDIATSEEEEEQEEPEEVPEEVPEEEPEEEPGVSSVLQQEIRNALMPKAKKAASLRKARKTTAAGKGLVPGSYVVAVYEEEAFLAEVSQDQDSVDTGYTRLNFMKINGMNRFIWGKPDILVTLNTDIIMKNVEPIPVNNRGCLGLKSDDLKKLSDIQTEMVALYSFSFLHSISFFLLEVKLLCPNVCWLIWSVCRSVCHNYLNLSELLFHTYPFYI